MRRHVLLNRIALMALALSACVIERDEPNLAGQDVHLTIVHTADLHSRFLPYSFAPGQIDRGLGLLPKSGQPNAIVGGIGRIGRVVKCIRGFYGADDPICKSLEPRIGETAARSLHLDSGDIFEGAPIFNKFNGEPEVRAMTQLGLSAMALGNHEFDHGAQNLSLQLEKFAGFPVLAANYEFDDPKDPTKPKLGRDIHKYVIFNVGGIKVGVIGMGNLSSMQGVIEGGNSSGIRPIEAVQAMTDTLAVVRPQVDIVTVVSHLGLDEDEGVAAAQAEASDQNAQIALAGVDVIFGGHLHIVLNPPKTLLQLSKESGEILNKSIVCHSGAFAKYVGRLDLIVHIPSADEVAAGVAASVKSHAYRVIPIDDTIPSDPDLDDLIEPYQFKMNQFLDLTQVFGIVPCPANATICPKTLRTDPNGGDSQLGNLVTTSMRLRHRVEADFALTNSLGIRTDFESGPLNLEQFYNVFPFENTITTMFLSGQEVQQLLDGVAARSAERGCRTQSQMAGIAFDLVCDPSQCEPGMRACAKNIYFGDNCRAPDNSFDGTNCVPLDAFGEYRVAVNDYIAAGGSGFSVLKRNTTKFNTGISLRDSLIDYIRSLTGRCDPVTYKNIVGVNCLDAQQATYDCSARCCCHDELSGPVLCGTGCTEFLACQGRGLSPKPYDYTDKACVDATIQAHDGRITAIGGGQ